MLRSFFYCLNQDLPDLQDFQDKTNTHDVNPENQVNPDSDKRCVGRSLRLLNRTKKSTTNLKTKQQINP
jgi:hypothetical protein